MNWDAITAIAELIGAAAVVLSLIYLAIQVRTGARALQTTMRDSSFHALTEYNLYLISDPDLPWEFHEGCRDNDALNEKQKARFVHTAYAFFKLFENLYLHYLDGSVRADAWEYNCKILVAYAAQPGAQSYIRARLPIFEPRFRQYLEALGPPEVIPGAAALSASVPAGSDG
jgi:hypothetical protein